ncbi:MAG: 2-oxoacid:acceptor oxidoreductase subunit alpha [Candidatus Glassbacteria bacterium]|nr:2-oxoacid:acceptor oxidoreductase subunit alpha [Candidatus Glassbacteria bacterium]
MGGDELNLGMVGSGGDGVMVTGEAIVNAAAKKGMKCLMLKAFGPQIRGGESSCKIRLSSKKVSAPPDRLDVLLAFKWDDYKRFGRELELNPGGVVIEDGKEGDEEPERPIVGEQPSKIYRVPLTEIATESAGNKLAKNMVALGVLSGLFDLPDDEMRAAISKTFAHKSDEIINSNISAYEAGKQYAQENLEAPENMKLVIDESLLDKRVVMTGNDATAYGALLAGCTFFAGYPITPSSEIMEWLSNYMPVYGGTMVQTEDEIAALGMVIGASLAGAKSMTATSGPGFSLMIELIGLASIAEIPCVIVNAQRVGPSTGIPTKSEQSDLLQACFGTHGDAPKVVIAPADVADCFDVMREAFFISEKYQLPVIVLSDGFIAQCKSSIHEPELDKIRPWERARPNTDEVSVEDYKRYEITKTGITWMSIPGKDPHLYRSAGIEHDELGSPTSDFAEHERMNEKRYRKLAGVAEEVNFMRHYGPDDAKVGVIAWGSSKGPLREAVEILNARGHAVKALVPQVLYPLNTEKVYKFFESLDKLLVVELSYSKQFLNLLKIQLDLPAGTVHYGRSGGKPLAIYEMLEQIGKLLD